MLRIGVGLRGDERNRDDRGSDAVCDDRMRFRDLSCDRGRRTLLFAMSLVWHARHQDSPRHIWLRRVIVDAAAEMAGSGGARAERPDGLRSLP